MPVAEQQDLVVIPTQQPEPSLLAIIAQAALNPTVDVEKMRALLELKERIDENEAKKQFQAAMIAAQDEMRPVVRNCENTDSHSRYANLEAIDKAIRPIYTKHGFVLTFNSEPGVAGIVVMSCTCMHRGGFSKDYKMQAPVDDSGIKGTRNKTGVMAAGSTVSYLRRYVTCMVFNIVLVNEDDDGQGAAATISLEQVNRIRDLMIACEMNDQRAKDFLKYMAVKEVDFILERDYQKAVVALTTQLNAKRNRGGK